MANETDALDYVHPIIQAMMAAQQAKQQAVTQELAKKSQSDENAVRQQQLKLEQQRIDAEAAAHEAANKHAQDILNAQLSATKALNAFKAHELVQSIYEKGGTPPVTDYGTNGNPNKVAPHVDLQKILGSIPGLEDINITPGTYATAEQIGKQKVQQAGEQAGAVAAAQQPYELQRLGVQGENQKALAVEQGKQRQAEINQTEAGNMLRTKLQGENQLAVANLNGQFQLAAAKIRVSNAGKDLNDSAVNNLLNDIYINGSERSVPAALQKQLYNSVPVDWHKPTPSDVKVIKSIPLIQNFIDKTEQLNQLIQQNPVVGRVQYTTNAGAVGDLKRELVGMMGNIATSISGEVGRKTEDDINRVKGLVFNPLSFDYSKAQELKGILQSAVGGTISQFKNPDQLTNVMIAHDIDPSLLNKVASPKKTNDPLGIR